MSDTCSSCRYWVPNDEPHGITSDHGWGECRRYPPQMVVAQPGKYRAMAPITTGDVGCGEHKERVGPVASTRLSWAAIFGPAPPPT